MSTIRYEFIMSQIQHIRDIKENNKIKISLVFYEGCQAPCVLKVCKNRDLTKVYQALMETSHSNLAKIYDCVYVDGSTYVVEEYLAGKTLAEILEGKGTFSEKETTEIMSGVCEGLEMLHHMDPPIIHNDIKCSNIMMCEDGTAKLFDYDISRVYKDGATKNTQLMGTKEYAAPEHYGFGQSEPCTDIYSLGVTMHEMLTGAGLDAEHNITYQGELANVIRKCVEIDRKKRYASASALKVALGKYLKSSAWKWKLVLAGICGALVLTAGGVFLAKNMKDGDAPENTEKVEQNSEMETEIETELETEAAVEESEMPSSEAAPEENNSEAVRVPEASIPKKSMKIVHQISDTFLTMNAWNDGTFLFMEEISGKYYLRSSDGKERLLEDVKAPKGAQLECNPYTNQMYLLTKGYNGEENIYSVGKDLQLEFVLLNEVGSTGFMGFFSDGTLVYDAKKLNGSDWSFISQYANFYQPHIIKDTLYSFEFISLGAQLEYFFFERTDTWEVVREFPLEAEGIIFHDYYETGVVYNNSKDVYFVGQKEDNDYLYRFDGDKFNPIMCLHEFENYVPFAFMELCVTDTAMRCYSYPHRAIVEFSLK